MEESRDNRVRSDFDEVADGYEAEVRSAVAFTGVDHTALVEAKGELISRLLDRFLSSVRDRPSRVLDLGCGIGLLGPQVAAAGYAVTGLDTSFASLARGASLRSPVSYVQYAGAEIPVQAESFDAVFTVNVMHHVPPEKWSSFLREARRVTRPGGLLIVLEHNPWNPVTRHIVSRCSFDEDAVLISRSEMRRLLQAAGYEPVYGRFIAFTPWTGPLFTRLDRLLGRLPFGAQYYLVGRR